MNSILKKTFLLFTYKIMKMFHRKIWTAFTKMIHQGSLTNVLQHTATMSYIIIHVSSFEEDNSSLMDYIGRVDYFTISKNVENFTGQLTQAITNSDEILYNIICSWSQTTYKKTVILRR